MDRDLLVHAPLARRHRSSTQEQTSIGGVLRSNG
jgi:hypothetical protein